MHGRHNTIDSIASNTNIYILEIYHCLSIEALEGVNTWQALLEGKVLVPKPCASVSVDMDPDPLARSIASEKQGPQFVVCKLFVSSFLLSRYRTTPRGKSTRSGSAVLCNAVDDVSSGVSRQKIHACMH